MTTNTIDQNQSSVSKTRPWRYKGGSEAAQQRYKESHREVLKERHRREYQKNKERYKKASSEYRRTHRKQVYEMNARWQRARTDLVRMEMLKAYGGKCCCCGETEQAFLELDHIYNDGAAERRKHKNGFQEWLVLQKKGWPKDRHQLLCANCNKGKLRNHGVCPHKTKNLS